MKKLLAAALGVAVVAAVLVVSRPASAAGSTSSYMNAKSSLRYVVDDYVFAPTTTTSNVSGAFVGAVPPGKHTLACITMHQDTAGAGGGTWKATPKKNGTSLVLTPGQLGTGAGANKAVKNTSCPMPTLGNAAASDFVAPVVSTTTRTANGGDLITIDVDFVTTWTSVPHGIVKLYWEPVY